ncbi:hypothetical protein V8F06_006285, partial [Rhypophila decipiens]
MCTCIISWQFFCLLESGAMCSFLRIIIMTRRIKLTNITWLKSCCPPSTSALGLCKSLSGAPVRIPIHRYNYARGQYR